MRLVPTMGVVGCFGRECCNQRLPRLQVRSMASSSSVRQQFTAPAGATFCTVGYRVAVTPQTESYFLFYVELLKADQTVLLLNRPVTNVL